MLITEIKKEQQEWSQTIDYITKECIQMKNRLSDFLEIFHASFIVEWAEDFQSRIIMKEQVLFLIRNDLKTQQSLIENNYLKENHDTLEEQHDNIRNKIDFLEKSCLEMKQSFNDFLSIHMLL